MGSCVCRPPATACSLVRLRTMGRRKIEMEYLTDDRVRKVTFCKRKGGLFKKAQDLSLLCGCEVAVVILCENKTCQFASTDMERILSRYQAMNSNTGAMMPVRSLSLSMHI